MIKKIFLFLFTIFNSCSLLEASLNTDSLLRVLDYKIANRHLFEKEREAEIARLNSLLTEFTPAGERDEILGQLFQAWMHFNADSAYHYSLIRLEHAISAGNNYWEVSASLNRAEVLNTAGMFKEALEQVEAISPAIKETGHLLYSYHIYRAIYGSMADFALHERIRAGYLEMVNLYRDSIMQLIPGNSPGLSLVKADAMVAGGDCAGAINLLLNCPFLDYGNGRHMAMVAYTLASAYACEGNRENYLYWLTRSAIHDISSAVKEYISLWELALLLFELGDVDRAYAYLQCSLEDAIFSNSRTRATRVSELFPLIHGAYQAKETRQKELMSRFLIAISTLLIILLATLVYILLQVKWLKTARQKLDVANNKLIGLNSDLTLYNQMLNVSNIKLTDASRIKEEYVGRYMEQCAAYIEKLDDYRRQVKRRLIEGDTGGLLSEIKSTRLVEDELETFHAGFDNTFLRLFPTFVEEFNALVNHDDRIILKPGELLNTELRIFALIRLGITDSEKIARFLRYSVSTIYNYRTKARNKAAGSRKEFENKIMQIGSPGTFKS